MVNLARSCWRKRAYATSKLAQQQIRKTYKEQGLRVFKYRCSSCDQYHLTKTPLAKGKII